MKVTAIAQRSGIWWAIRIPEVDGAFTQTRRLDQIPAMAADAVALLADVAPGSVEVVVEAHTDSDSLIARARESRQDADHAATRAAQAMRQAAHQLLAEQFTVRDTGELLGVSAQRVSQLAHEDKLIDA